MNEPQRIDAAGMKAMGEHARSILANPAFDMAMDAAKAAAIDALIKTNPTDVDAIRDHQATIRGIDRVREALQDLAQRASPRQISVV